MTTALGTPRPGTLSAPALSAAVDLMRALAALLMITNHVGVLLLAPELSEAGLIGFTVFVGSAAPVLFFFVTGFGLGLRRPDAPPPRWAGLDKALPLWIADLFLVWQGGRLWGLDFFAFSAIAMVVVGWVASQRRAVTIACLLIAGLFVLRFGIAPRVGPLPDLVVWSMGFPPLDGVAYPLSPWLIYPLVGFVLARWSAHWRPRLPWAAVAAALIVLAAVLGAAAAMAASRGMVMNRWSSVSIAWFVASIGILSAMAALSLIVQGIWPQGSARLGLRGVPAFLVVPVHYLLIAIGQHASLELRSGPAFVGFVIAVTVAAIALSRWMGQGWIVRAAQERLALGGAALVGAGATAVMLAMDGLQRLPLVALGTLGCVAVAVWLTSMLQGRGPARIEARPA